MDIEAIITDLFEREGGFVNHPADRGGPTNRGITLETLRSWRQHPVSVDELKALSEVETRSIYRGRYLIAPRLHVIKDPYVLVLAFDCAVHHGPERAVEWLQEIVGVKVDGQLGPISEVAINAYEPVRLYHRLIGRRLRFFGEIISHDPKLRYARQLGLRLQAEFAGGWCNRAAEFVELHL